MKVMKLRELTEQDFKTYCKYHSCCYCLLGKLAERLSTDCRSVFKNKNIFSENILNTLFYVTPPTLTQDERNYLKAAINHFRPGVISKVSVSDNRVYLEFNPQQGCISHYTIDKPFLFEGLEFLHSYTLKELKLN